MAKMEVGGFELFKILNTTLRIPPYQRDASWPVKKVMKLWESISEFVSTSDSHKTKHVFYLGNIVTHSKLNLVDGQQRMNSVTIIASALRDVLIHLGKIDKAYKIHQSLVKKDGSSMYKLNEKNEESFKAMELVRVPGIQGELGLEIKSLTDHGIVGKKRNVTIFLRGKSKWHINSDEKLHTENGHQISVKTKIHEGQYPSQISGTISPTDSLADYDGLKLMFGGRQEPLTGHQTCEAYSTLCGVFLHQFTDIECESDWKREKALASGTAFQAKFNMPYDWPTPTSISSGDVVTVEKNDGTTYPITQERDGRKYSQKFNVYTTESAPRILPAGKITIKRSDIYTKNDARLQVADIMIERYIKVIENIYFGVTNFKDYTDALEHFTLANDGSRMEPLYNYDLFHAMTHKFIAQLKESGDDVEAKKIEDLWNDEISTTILPREMNRHESLKNSNAFFGRYSLSKNLQNDDGKRFKWERLGSTEMFTKIEDDIKDNPVYFSGAMAQPGLVEFYEQLAKYSWYHEVATDPVRTVEITTGAVDDNFLYFEARALIVTLLKLNKEIFAPLLMSIFYELRNESVEDRSATTISCLKVILHYITRYWVVSGIQSEQDGTRMKIVPSSLYGMFENDAYGWSSQIQNVANPNADLPELVKKPFAEWVTEQVGKTGPDWPLNNDDANMDVKKYSTEGTFLLHLYQYTRTDGNKYKDRFLKPKKRNAKGKYEEAADHAECEHILPKDEAMAKGKDASGTKNAWPTLRTKWEENWQKLGNLCLLEYNINRGFSRKGWQNIKFANAGSEPKSLKDSDFYKEQFHPDPGSTWTPSKIKARSIAIMAAICDEFDL
jgi:hypothetical protein